MSDYNHRSAQVDAFVKKNKVGLIVAAAAAALLFANAGNSNTVQPQPGNQLPAAQGPRQVPQQGPQQGPMTQGEDQTPYGRMGEAPEAGYDPSVGVVPAGVPAVDPGVTGGGDSGVDMDAWRRRQAQDDIEQRQRVDTIREEERCRNSDGTEDTVSIHTGC